jgi:hypothetical protein
MRLRELRDIDRVRCQVCEQWIEPGSSIPASVSVILDGEGVGVEFTHAGCGGSRADLARLVARAGAAPLGIEYAQALHPEAGAVLLWERTLDLRVRGLGGESEALYLDPDWWEGFHPARPEEPVRLLAGWLLAREEGDLVLRRGEKEIERFHGAREHSPPGWLESLEDSGFCLLIVGAGIGLERPAPPAIQRAMREGRALMGFSEFDPR